MRSSLIAAAATLAALALSASAQIHKVAPAEEVVRAVGVYEWIGERDKPAASRFIPVSLFIDGSLQDAAVYLARPIPFALDSGTIYEVDRSGVPAGTLDVLYASRLQAAPGAAEFDDGWFGYGTFAPPAPPKPAKPLKTSKAPSQVVSSKPDLKGSNDKENGDPDRPHMIRRSEPSTPDTTSDSTVPGTPATSEKPVSTGGVPAADPDRPTLRKRSPEEAKKAKKSAQESSASGLATSLNDDPNRPTLHRGAAVKPLSEADMPKLKGVPVGLHQEIAVSDAKDRPTHDFSRPWTDATERATVLARMQELAHAQVETYKAQAVKLNAASQAAQPDRPVLARGTPNSRLRRPKPSAPAPAPLVDEQLIGYTLSYGGSPTYLYTARTAGEGAALIYVTVVAQADMQGQLQPAIESATDAAHLDRTPWMRPIDAVDAEASNRASLLFELRGDTARQFALYRVIAARAEQTFLTGTTQ